MIRSVILETLISTSDLELEIRTDLDVTRALESFSAQYV